MQSLTPGSDEVLHQAVEQGKGVSAACTTTASTANNIEDTAPVEKANQKLEKGVVKDDVGEPKEGEENEKKRL